MYVFKNLDGRTWNLVINCTLMAINLENFGVGSVLGPTLINRLSEWGGLCSLYYFPNRDYYVIINLGQQNNRKTVFLKDQLSGHFYVTSTCCD